MDDYTGPIIDATFQAIRNAVEYALAELDLSPEHRSKLTEIVAVIDGQAPEPQGIWYINRTPLAWVNVRKSAPAGDVVAKWFKSWRAYIVETRRIDGWSALWGRVTLMQDWAGRDIEIDGWLYMNYAEMD